ncbi:FadR/GntR family transcriptional regulator [Salinibacterium hongtaonis]|uniref:FadR/GntR family transcriptional regulator n=1 Tax=Homoserinimonas hongtaonis TaxID=2079791 RepID=UPI000D3404A8|nr:FCD domain-containing protein [Salinibacterium hongtaonis]AWB89382.1 GntR family transcriptional regulator [Salinibacterium hongtaonis]
MAANGEEPNGAAERAPLDEAPQELLAAELLLRPARSANVFEETMQRLLQSVRLGLIGPGERLPAERVLATMLGVSRDTVRDAIAALTDAGYLASRRGRYGGTFVVDALPELTPVVTEEGVAPRRSVPRAELEDTLVLRAILEVGAARQAALSELTGPQRDSLWQALQECSAAEPSDYRRSDSRLHLLIAELVGSPSLVPLVADIRMRVNELLDGIPLLAPNIIHSNEQHEAIVKAILRGNPEEATRAMEEHIAGSEALLRGFLA